MHKIVRMRDYAPVISQLITLTNQTGGKLEKYFNPLKRALKKNNLNSVDLKKTYQIFQKGTNQYQDNLRKLSKTKSPVKVMGPSHNLVMAYRDYVNSCQAMTDSIDVVKNSVDVDKFNRSEKDQESNMKAIISWIRRIMA